MTNHPARATTGNVSSPEITGGNVMLFPGVTPDMLATYSADVQNDHLVQLTEQFDKIDNDIREKGLDSTDADLSKAFELKIDLAAQLVSGDDCSAEEAAGTLIDNRDRALMKLARAKGEESLKAKGRKWDDLFATEEEELALVKATVAPTIADKIAERAKTITKDAANTSIEAGDPNTLIAVKQRTSERWSELKDKFKRNPAETDKNKHVQRLAKLSRGSGMLATSSWLQEKLASRQTKHTTDLSVGAVLIGTYKKARSGISNGLSAARRPYDNAGRKLDLYLKNTAVPAIAGRVSNAYQNKNKLIRNEDDKIRKGIKIALGVGGTAVAALLMYKNLNGLQDLAHNFLPDGSGSGKTGTGGTSRTGSKGLGSSISEHLHSNGIGKSTSNIAERATDQHAIDALDAKLGMPEHLPTDVKQNLRQAAVDIVSDHGVEIGSDDFNKHVTDGFQRLSDYQNHVDAVQTIQDAQQTIELAHPDVIQGTPEYADLIDKVFGLAQAADTYKPAKTGVPFDEAFKTYWQERNNIIQTRGISQQQFDQQFIAFIEHMKKLEEARELAETVSSN